MNIKKFLVGTAASVVILTSFAGAAFAVTPNWDVSGSWVFDYHYGTTVNLHDMTLTQDVAGNLTGSGGAFSGILPYQYPWTIDSGSVSGNDIVFTAHYTATVVCSFTATGTIASDGTMGGTWTDNCDGPRSGTWTTTIGTAKDITIPSIPTGIYFKDTVNNKNVACGGVTSARNFDVYWNANPESDINHYEYDSYNAGGSIGLVNYPLTTPYFIASWWTVPVEGTYGVQVRAVDNAGNKSEWYGGALGYAYSCKYTADWTAPATPNLI